MMRSNRGGMRRGMAMGWALACVTALVAPAADDAAIPLIESFPDAPAAPAIPDWRARALGFDRLAFDDGARGEFLPLARVALEGERPGLGGFDLPAYVGMPGNDSQAITALAALVGGSLMGIDKRAQNGRDWVRLADAWFSRADGTVTNNRGGGSGSSAWYDIVPGMLFCQLADLYPGEPLLAERVRTMADRWARAVDLLGGPVAEFDHTAFDLRAMRPVDNGRWREPDMAAGIGWIEYMAWARWGDARHREAALRCLDALERRPAAAGNPLYETMLFYAPALAARANAELDRAYDVGKLLRWLFSPNASPGAARPHWGIVAGRWGGFDVDGLQGSCREGEGYAFAMNTFQAAAALAPLARYDERWARPLGKWLLHVATNARLFYPDALPATHQQTPRWVVDPPDVIPHEGLRQHAHELALPISERALRGRVESGDLAAAGSRDPDAQTLVADAAGALEHLWEFRAPPDLREGRFHFLAGGDAAPGTLALSAAPAETGPWRRLFLFPHPTSKGPDHVTHGARLDDMRGWGRILVKIETAPGARAGRVAARHVRWYLDCERAPYAMGDPPVQQWGARTGLAIYGGAHVGYLAAVVARTNEPRILRIDLLATDWCRGRAWPTALYYNPETGPRRVRIRVGPGRRDLYDAVADGFVARDVRGETTIDIGPARAAVVVEIPSGIPLGRHGRTLKAAETVIDYRAETAR